MGHLMLGSFGKLEKVVAVVDTRSHDLVVAGTFAVEPLTRAEANKYLKSHRNRCNFLWLCPAGFEGFFCTEASYVSVTYLTALAKTEFLLHKNEVVFCSLSKVVVQKLLVKKLPYIPFQKYGQVFFLNKKLD